MALGAETERLKNLCLECSKWEMEKPKIEIKRGKARQGEAKRSNLKHPKCNCLSQSQVLKPRYAVWPGHGVQYLVFGDERGTHKLAARHGAWLRYKK